MSAWLGLHNPKRHAPTSVTDMAWCNACDGPCYSPEACRCCLAAEVERLTAAQAERDRRIAATLSVCEQHNDTNVGAAAAAILRGESDG